MALPNRQNPFLVNLCLDGWQPEMTWNATNPSAIATWHAENPVCSKTGKVKSIWYTVCYPASAVGYTCLQWPSHVQSLIRHALHQAFSRGSAALSLSFGMRCIGLCPVAKLRSALPSQQNKFQAGRYYFGINFRKSDSEFRFGLISSLGRLWNL